MTIQQSIHLLQQLVAVPSESRNEAAAADLFFNALVQFGLSPRRVANNVFLSTPIDTSKPTLMLNAHIDTVKPVAGWTYNPFSPTLVDDRLYGLGTNDDGASLVSLLNVYTQLSAKPQAYNLVFAASAEEEVSGKNGIELLLRSLPKIDVALVGEPTNMRMAVAERGLMVWDCETRGKAGHAARNEGVNAIYKALSQIDIINSYQFPKVSPELGPVKMSVTMINAGTQHNVVPDKCTFVVDVRTNDCYSNLEVLQQMKSRLQCDLEPRSTRLNSSHIDKSHPLVQAGLRLNLDTFGSPTLSDQALMNFPSLKLGPGDSSRSHTADEYICLSEISQAISLYMRLLDNLIL